MIDIDRIWHPYTIWEDFLNGLYSKEIITCDLKTVIFKCANLLKNSNEFYNVMQKVIQDWKKATEFNLSNISRNRQAWLGQASCCYMFNAPEYVTKLAWHTLTNDEQKKANDIADKVIYEWERIYYYGNGLQTKLINYA